MLMLATPGKEGRIRSLRLRKLDLGIQLGVFQLSLQNIEVKNNDTIEIRRLILIASM